MASTLKRAEGIIRRGGIFLQGYRIDGVANWDRGRPAVPTGNPTSN